jgi:Family of unknown function (DUF5675)
MRCWIAAPSDKMLITVSRKTYTSESTQGLMGLNGIYECNTLEPRRDQSQGKPFCVPEGTYAYRIGPSVRFDRNVVLIDGIPGFENVEIHMGNFPSDTHGCVLVGKTEAINFVGQSDVEFDTLLGKLPPVGQIQFEDMEEIDATD